MKSTRNLIIIITLIGVSTVVTSPAQAQRGNPRPVVGISAMLQSNQLNILVPFWASPTIVVAPMFSLVYVENSGADVMVGVAPRLYTRVDRVSPYIGARLGAFLNLPKNGNSTTDWLFGIAVGGEYFLNQRFSLGVEAQGNATFSDDLSGRFGNPGGFTFSTATAVFATIYF